MRDEKRKENLLPPLRFGKKGTFNRRKRGAKKRLIIGNVWEARERDNAAAKAAGMGRGGKKKGERGRKGGRVCRGGLLRARKIDKDDI